MLWIHIKVIDISHANHVWSTDIAYIKIAGGMVCMAAYLDWHDKACYRTRYQIPWTLSLSWLYLMKL